MVRIRGVSSYQGFKLSWLNCLENSISAKGNGNLVRVCGGGSSSYPGFVLPTSYCTL